MPTVPLLSDLREPPVVGHRYLVPVVRNWTYHGRMGTWPVLGSLHDDRDFFEFQERHYHVDQRFLTEAQCRHLQVEMGRGDLGVRLAMLGGHDIEAFMNEWPLSSNYVKHRKGRPELAVRQCIRSTFTFSLRHAAIEKMRAHYGEPAEPVRLGDGRILCPHRKADLSTFEPDANGVVTCPLHGLRVQCGARP